MTVLAAGVAACTHPPKKSAAGRWTVGIGGVRDLQTNVDEAFVWWSGPPGRHDGTLLSDEQVLGDLARATSVVAWPSGTPVPGRFEIVAGAPGQHATIRFVRAARARDGWEAIVVDGARLPEDFELAHGKTVLASGDRLLARYAPVSRPTIARVVTRPVELPAGGAPATGYPALDPTRDFLTVVFSEPVSSAAEIHELVRIETGGADGACEPYASSAGEDAPTGTAMWQCPRFAEGQRVRVVVDGELQSAAGAPIGRSYANRTEIVADVELRGDDSMRLGDTRYVEQMAGIAAERILP